MDYGHALEFMGLKAGFTLEELNNKKNLLINKVDTTNLNKAYEVLFKSLNKTIYKETSYYYSYVLDNIKSDLKQYKFSTDDIRLQLLINNSINEMIKTNHGEKDLVMYIKKKLYEEFQKIKTTFENMDKQVNIYPNILRKYIKFDYPLKNRLLDQKDYVNNLRMKLNQFNVKYNKRLNRLFAILNSINNKPELKEAFENVLNSLFIRIDSEDESDFEDGLKIVEDKLDILCPENFLEISNNLFKELNFNTKYRSKLLNEIENKLKTKYHEQDRKIRNESKNLNNLDKYLKENHLVKNIANNLKFISKRNEFISLEKDMLNTYKNIKSILENAKYNLYIESLLTLNNITFKNKNYDNDIIKILYTKLKNHTEAYKDEKEE